MARFGWPHNVPGRSLALRYQPLSFTPSGKIHHNTNRETSRGWEQEVPFVPYFSLHLPVHVLSFYLSFFRLHLLQPCGYRVKFRLGKVARWHLGSPGQVHPVEQPASLELLGQREGLHDHRHDAARPEPCPDGPVPPQRIGASHLRPPDEEVG